MPELSALRQHAGETGLLVLRAACIQLLLLVADPYSRLEEPPTLCENSISKSFFGQLQELHESFPLW